MPDPFRTEENRLPEPHRDFAGVNNADGVGKRAFKALAKLWQPRGTTSEEAAATVSRYAMRLIDRVTGKAYSADEIVPSSASLISAIESNPAATREALSVRNLVAPFWKPLKRISAYQDDSKPVVIRTLVDGDSWRLGVDSQMAAKFGNFGKIVGPKDSDKSAGTPGNVFATTYFESYAKTPFEGRYISMTGTGNVIFGEGNGARRLNASGRVIVVMYERVSGGGILSVQYETAVADVWMNLESGVGNANITGNYLAASGSGALPVAGQINTGSGAGASEFAIATFVLPAAVSTRVRCTWVSGTSAVYAAGVVSTTDLEPVAGTVRQGHVECDVGVGSASITARNGTPQAVWNTLLGWLKPDLIFFREASEISSSLWSVQFEAYVAKLRTAYDQFTLVCPGSHPTSLLETQQGEIDAYLEGWCAENDAVFIPLRQYFPSYATYLALGLGDTIHMTTVTARYAEKVIWDYLSPFHHFAAEGGNTAPYGGLRPYGDGVSNNSFWVTFDSTVPSQTGSLGIRDKGRGTNNFGVNFEVRGIGAGGGTFANGFQILGGNSLPFFYVDNIGRTVVGPGSAPTRTPGSASSLSNGAHWEFFGNNTGLVTLSMQVQSGQAQNAFEFRTGATTSTGGTLVTWLDLRGNLYSTGLPVFADDASSTFSHSCTTTNNSPNVTTASTTGYFPGMTVAGTGIQAGTKILSITNGTTFVLTANATASATNTLAIRLGEGAFYRTSTGEVRIKLA